MSIYGTSVTFGGKTILRVDPREARYRYAIEKGANSLTIPVGQEAARGFFVMQRDDLTALDLTTTKTLKFESSQLHTGGKVNQKGKLEIKGLYVVNDPVRLDTCGDDNDRAAYLVEVTDIRGILNRFTSISKGYNLRKPGASFAPATASRFYTTSLNAGAVWTWSTMAQDLWTTVGLAGTWPTLPYTPTGVPEDFRFFGVNAWDALHQVLRQIGCTTAITPTAASTTFTIVRLGTTQTSLSEREAKYEQIESHNLNALSAVPTRVPHTIRVFFYYRDERQPDNWALAPYSVDKTTGVTGAVASTVLPLWSIVPARYDFTSGLAASSATLDTIAGEIKDNWLAINNLSRARKVYPGIVADLFPGSQLRAVEWRDSGDGWQTTTSRRPETCLWSEKPLWPAAERLNSVEHWIHFKLSETLNPGSDAFAVIRIFSGGTWSDAGSVDVYDSIGDKSGPAGLFGWARWSTESMRYEIVQLECG